MADRAYDYLLRNFWDKEEGGFLWTLDSVSYTHLRAHETVLDLVCRLLLEKNTKKKSGETHYMGRYESSDKTELVTDN